eukprot:14365240-Heterocapsa_arctica.AAC.1
MLCVGKSSREAGLLVCPNSFLLWDTHRLAAVTGLQGFLVCCSGFQPVSFMAPDVASGESRSTSPSAPTGASLPASPLLTPTTAGWLSWLRGGLPPVQPPPRPSPLPPLMLAPGRTP